MSGHGSVGDGREHSGEVDRTDGLGAGPTRAAAAVRRDEAAAERDSAANARDGIAAAAALNPGPPSHLSTAEGSDQRSARDREAAAGDRIEASLDRAQAAMDRELAKDGISNELSDLLTGAMGARFGLAALRRELLRTERTEEILLVAFVEPVDQEPDANESRRTAKDEVLQDLAQCLSDDLRDYDLMARVGDQGFVCAQPGQSISRATVRYHEIAARLALRSDGAQMKVGLVEREAGDTFEALLERAAGSILETV
jgi:PleD family two-component response regulator